MGDVLVEQRPMDRLDQPVDLSSVLSGNRCREQARGVDQGMLNQEWDSRKGVGAATATPEATSFGQAIDQKAGQALQRLEGVDKSLGVDFSKIDFRSLLGKMVGAQQADLSDQQTTELVRDIAKDLKPTIEQTPPHVRQEVTKAFSDVKDAHTLLQGSLAAQPDSPAREKLVREVNEVAGSSNDIINIAIRMAEAAGDEVGRYADNIGKRLDKIQLLNNLETLMSKYKGAENVDLLKPKEGQEADFAKIEKLRKTLVEEHQVPLNWTEAGWNKETYEAYAQAIKLCREAEFALNQKDNIFLQKLTSAEQHFWLMVTNFLSRLAEILREMARNMAR